MVKSLWGGIPGIRKFLDIPDPDPLVRGTDLDPDPSIMTQK